MEDSDVKLVKRKGDLSCVYSFLFPASVEQCTSDVAMTSLVFLWGVIAGAWAFC